jgi:hypothetical protein
LYPFEEIAQPEVLIRSADVVVGVGDTNRYGQNIQVPEHPFHGFPEPAPRVGMHAGTERRRPEIKLNTSQVAK